MYRKRIFLAAFLCVSANLVALEAQVKWYKIEEAEKEAAKTGKKIMVDVYTNWCGWCKEMDKGTFPEKNVAKILNESYIPVKFNAEQLENITWGGTVYKVVRPKNSGRYHQLAANWLNGQLSFPTIVILDEHGKMIQAINGYRRAAEFEKIIAFFATDSHKTTQWAVFEKSYKRK